MKSSAIIDGAAFWIIGYTTSIQLFASVSLLGLTIVNLSIYTNDSPTGASVISRVAFMLEQERGWAR
jgi:hypothetical protein